MSSIFTDKKNLAGPSRHCQYLHHVELVSKFPGSIAIRLVSASSLACQASSYGKSGFFGIVGEYNLQMQLNLSFLFRVPSTVCNKTHLSHNVALKKQGKRQASVKSWHWSKSPTSAFVNYSALQGHLFVAHRELVPKRFFFLNTQMHHYEHTFVNLIKTLSCYVGKLALYSRIAQAAPHCYAPLVVKHQCWRRQSSSSSCMTLNIGKGSLIGVLTFVFERWQIARRQMTLHKEVRKLEISYFDTTVGHEVSGLTELILQWNHDIQQNLLTSYSNGVECDVVHEKKKKSCNKR